MVVVNVVKEAGLMVVVNLVKMTALVVLVSVTKMKVLVVWSISENDGFTVVGNVVKRGG